MCVAEIPLWHRMINTFNYVSADGPSSLRDLIGLQVHQRVDKRYYDFGILLLDDSDGKEVERIRKKHESNEERVIEVLKVWIERRKLPVTWKNLINSLRRCKIMDLANSIEDEKIIGKKNLPEIKHENF